MKLFLASEFIPELQTDLEKFAGKSIADSKVVYIPTAANGESEYKWNDTAIYKFAKSTVKSLHVLELEKTNKQELIEAMSSADMIWMGGGKLGYLLEWMINSGFSEIIDDLYLRDDLVYVGSSAGSMACSVTQNVGEWYIGEEEAGVSLLSGLGLIDFEIYPHYEDKLYDKIDENWKKGELYLLKDGEAITVSDYKIGFIGKPKLIRK